MPLETSYTPAKSSHVVFKDGTDSKPIEAVADVNGSGAVRYTTNTTAVTGVSARQIQCLTDTVFSVFTRTNATGSITGSRFFNVREVRNDGQLVGVIFHMPHKPPAEFGSSPQTLQRVWQQVHSHLDQSPAQPLKRNAA